jgi:hypothetical protein
MSIIALIAGSALWLAALACVSVIPFCQGR